jgi:hypothetical protein
MRIRIQQLNLMRIHANPDTDPDPKPWINGSRIRGRGSRLRGRGSRIRGRGSRMRGGAVVKGGGRRAR